MLKKFFFVFILLLLNNCATSGSALLGPILTGAKTGSIYQASFSYSTGKVFNEFISTEIRYFQNTKKDERDNIKFPDIPFSEYDPIIIAYYKVDDVKFSEIIEPEPLP